MNNYTDSIEIIQTVAELNTELSEKLGVNVEYSTTGFCEAITMNNAFVLWDSENDEREYNEDSDEMEDLKVFLKRKIEELAENMKLYAQEIHRIK